MDVGHATIPQSDAGARRPFSSRAPFMATYVFDGNVENARQLCAALYVRFVSFATSAVPPSASMTSLVVPNSCIGTVYNQRFLDNQAP